MHHLQDRQADIQTDEVGQRQRSHRVRHAEFHDRVHGLRRGHALHDRIDRLIDHRQEDAVGHESGVVVHFHGRLAELRGDLQGAAGGGVAGGVPADHLDQLHDGHRIHEVHPDDLPGPAGLRSDLGDRNGARIRGQNGLGSGDAVQLLEDLELERRVFRGGLNHQIHPGGRRQGGGCRDPPEDRCRRIRRQGPLLHLTIQVGLDRRQPLVERRLGHVDQGDLPLMLGEDVGDAIAHGARPDHRHLRHDLSSRGMRLATTMVAVSRTMVATRPPSGPKLPPVSHAGPPGM